MDDKTESVSFNKRRAEGKNKNERPKKKPQRKGRALNPTNTTAYATFEDGMVDEAIRKSHSTTKEAKEKGNSAGVYLIILTHFSQRYPKIPVFDETHMHKTCIAFYLMSINVADLPVLPKVLPYLKMLFKNEMKVDELDEVLDAGNAAS